jgi:hypothetical protein
MNQSHLKALKTQTNWFCDKVDVIVGTVAFRRSNGHKKSRILTREY